MGELEARATPETMSLGEPAARGRWTSLRVSKVDTRHCELSPT